VWERLKSIGIALFMTMFIMMPTFQEVNQNAYQPFMAKNLRVTVIVIQQVLLLAGETLSMMIPFSLPLVVKQERIVQPLPNMLIAPMP